MHPIQISIGIMGSKEYPIFIIKIYRDCRLVYEDNTENINEIDEIISQWKKLII